jgi:hypothetical protein
MADFDSICPLFTGFLGASFKAAHPDEFGPDGRVRVCLGGGAGFIGSHIAKKLKQEVYYLISDTIFCS